MTNSEDETLRVLKRVPFDQIVGMFDSAWSLWSVRDPGNTLFDFEKYGWTRAEFFTELETRVGIAFNEKNNE